MEIRTPEKPPKKITDMDFTLEGGILVPIPLMLELGDTIDYKSNPGWIEIYLCPKPSPANPDTLLPAEWMSIPTQKILLVQKRERFVEHLTPTQEFEWKATLQELVGGTQKKPH